MAVETAISYQLPLDYPSSCERNLPSSYLEMLPDELLLKILVYVMSEQSPFSLENCIDCARTGQLFRSAAYSRLWHKTHLTDWLLINTTCRRIRHIGWEAFFTSKTVFASQSLGTKLIMSEDEPGWSPVSRPLFHASLLDYVRDLVIAPVNVQSASGFAKIPQFLQSFSNLRTCTLQISYRQGDSIDFVKDRRLIGKPTNPRRFSGMGMNTTQELKRRLVALGVSKKIDLKLAVCPHLDMTTTWYENILERNIFPMLDLRIELSSM
jgi:hypothetical protein